MSRGRRPAAGRGGAYLLALAAVLALSGLGIVLLGVAQTERRLGSLHRDQLQALNAADSGLAVATARLLDGAEPGELEILFGERRSGGVVAASRTKVAVPVWVATAPCQTCDPADPTVGKVSYALSAVGERVRWSLRASPAAARTVARVSVAATLTLQPWPDPGAPPHEAGAESPDPGCGPVERQRLLERLLKELHPPACRLGPGAQVVRAISPESGVACTVRVPVCVLLSDWRAR